MEMKWSTVGGKTFDKKWTTVQKLSRNVDVSPYDMLRELILRDPNAFKIDAGGMRPEHAAGPDAKEYEIVVLLAASHFTTVRPTGRGIPHDRRRFETFDAAVADAGDVKQVLIYGICESGRAAVLSRDLWKAYSTIIAAVSERDSQSVIEGAAKKYSNALKRLADK